MSTRVTRVEIWRMRVNELEYFSFEHFEIRRKWRRPAIFLICKSRVLFSLFSCRTHELFIHKSQDPQFCKL